MNSYPTPDSKNDISGSNAKIFGIVALIVSFCCCSVIGIILAVVSLVYASKSKQEMGQITKDAEIGKILSIIAIVVSALSLLSAVGFVIYCIIIEELPEFIPVY